MAVQKKLADTLRDSMNKIRNQQTENAKSSLCILRKTRQDFENSEIGLKEVMEFSIFFRFSF